jgi:twinfilin-like protein
MARANLNLTSEISNAFVAAQESSSNVRALKIKIVDEDLLLESTITKQGDAPTDFDSLLAPALSERDASLICFCVTDGAVGSGGKKWMLLAWVPDGCRVRDKMLYSSSREDLKRNLGRGYFSGEYSANEKVDVSWAAYQAFCSKDIDTNTLLTDTERLVIEENAMAHTESSATKSTAMGVVPFTLGAGVADAFRSFVNKSVNWLEISVKDEVIMLHGSKSVTMNDNLTSYVSNNDARFLIVRLPNHEGKDITFMIFSCPENIPIKSKMIMSTGKVTVQASAADHGLTWEKSLEIRGADEIMDSLRGELAPEVGTLSSYRFVSLNFLKYRSILLL